MKCVEKRGKSVEEAVELALTELGVSDEDVEVEVLEEATKGLFGLLGTKGARVKVTLKMTRAEAAERFLEDVLSAIGLDASISSTVEGEYVFFDIEGEDLGTLIGRRGQTLSALQYLTNLASAKGTIGHERVVIDVEGYRKRREETLRALARRVADRVRRTGQSVSLEPMNAQERRVIHTALQSDDYVATRSEGEDPYRKVIVHRKKH